MCGHGIIGVAATGASAYAEAGGHVPPGVTAGVGAAAADVDERGPQALQIQLHQGSATLARGDQEGGQAIAARIVVLFVGEAAKISAQGAIACLAGLADTIQYPSQGHAGPEQGR